MLSGHKSKINIFEKVTDFKWGFICFCSRPTDQVKLYTACHSFNKTSQIDFSISAVYLKWVADG